MRNTVANACHKRSSENAWIQSEKLRPAGDLARFPSVIEGERKADVLCRFLPSSVQHCVVESLRGPLHKGWIFCTGNAIAALSVPNPCLTSQAEVNRVPFSVVRTFPNSVKPFLARCGKFQSKAACRIAPFVVFAKNNLTSRFVLT